jgi:hypothetical protein
METKYELAFCVFFNAYIHGKDENSSQNIDSHYLILHSMNIDTFYNSLEFTIFMNMINMSRSHYSQHFEMNQQHVEQHPVIRNYKAAVLKKNYISLEIVQHVELQGGEHVAIYKTFWLRIIQRKWKKYYQYKMQLVRKLLKPRGLLWREIGTTFPHHSRNYMYHHNM